MKQALNSKNRPWIHDPDDFIDLQGQDMINSQNMESYLNVFEMELDDLINENGGVDCSLAIAEEKR